MRKGIHLMLFGILFLSACNVSVEVDDGGQAETIQTMENVNEPSAEKEAIHLQMTKIDVEAGATIESNEIYQMLDEFVQENPTLGVENDFSMHSMTMVSDEDDNTQMVFLAVNRLGEPIKNVNFNFTLGNTDGEMVWEDLPVMIDEQVGGVLENNAAMPVFLPVTSEEQVKLMNTISQDNLHIEFSHFTYDSLNE